MPVGVQGLRGDQVQLVHKWEQTVADTRLHGTTRLQVGHLLATVDRAALGPLPGAHFPCFRKVKGTGAQVIAPRVKAAHPGAIWPVGVSPKPEAVFARYFSLTTNSTGFAVARLAGV
jgi:hypothetical protein